MDTSIFMNKAIIPDDILLREALGETSKVWVETRNYVLNAYPKAVEEWNFSGQKYGWSYRVKDMKRAIIYLLPRKDYFLAAFVFGEKATKEALGSSISSDIKDIIESARVYVEGRGFRVEVREENVLTDIKKLIDIKLAY
jgi:hypothetical protein